MIVTDHKWTRDNGEPARGFSMNGYLCHNLQGIPGFLSKAWDFVGVISGHGKVGVGKSTLASQVGLLIAWNLAGGKMVLEKVENTYKIIDMKLPTKPLRYSLEENVVFSAEELMDRAVYLNDKYGKGQLLIYDEGRQGLDSKRAMESINKGMEDFFQEMRTLGLVILIVLPDFFKLHEDYAIGRSMFLIDCYVDKHYNRGNFKFYNEDQKEKLFFFGKKRIGIKAKYAASYANFPGTFSKFFPFDMEKYEEMKKEAIAKKRIKRFDRKLRLQRDILIYKMYKQHGIPLETIIDYFLKIGNVHVQKRYLEHIIPQVHNLELASKGYGGT